MRQQSIFRGVIVMTMVAVAEAVGVGVVVMRVDILVFVLFEKSNGSSVGERRTWLGGRAQCDAEFLCQWYGRCCGMAASVGG